MKINRNNYEPYFIDYLEGTLDEKLVDDFLEFLLQNPDLKEELSLFNSVSVEPEELTFTKKELLFKDKYDIEREFNKAAISTIEGDISAKEKVRFEKYIQTHPEKEKDFALFKATKLQPDKSITFRKKNKLYRYSAGRTVLLWSVRIAAILILAFTFYVVIDKSSNQLIPENQLAKVENKSPEKENKTEENLSPEKQEKQEPVKQEPKKAVKETSKPEIKEVKKAIPEKKQNRSLRENTQGRIEHEDVALLRIPVEVPEELNTITASLNVEQVQASLGTMYTILPDVPQTDDERFLADVIIEKTGLDKLNLNKITKAGLNLVASISNEKFNYETNEEGKVTEYNYDSRLLAFTIPSKNRTEDK